MQRQERLAVLMSDVLEFVPVEIRNGLLGGRLDVGGPPIIVPYRESTIRILQFTCDLLTAAVVCDLMRSNNRKIGARPTELYVMRDKWQRVSHTDVLTLVVDGHPRLNPAMFPPALVVGPPPVAKALRFGVQL